MRKSKTKSLARKKAWKYFSLYKRIRNCTVSYCLGMTDSKDEGICCTCGNKVKFKGSHTGHFLPGRRDSLLFNEANSDLQCPSCNTGYYGSPINYYKFMLKKYGQVVIDELNRIFLSKKKKEYNQDDYEKIALKYKTKYEKLLGK